jgi:hypothetical protein
MSGWLLGGATLGVGPLGAGARAAGAGAALGAAGAPPAQPTVSSTLMASAQRTLLRVLKPMFLRIFTPRRIASPPAGVNCILAVGRAAAHLGSGGRVTHYALVVVTALVGSDAPRLGRPR